MKAIALSGSGIVQPIERQQFRPVFCFNCGLNALLLSYPGFAIAGGFLR